MYHIIVPIDFSEESLKGLELAILLSSKKECTIQMVYVQKKSLDYNPGSKEEEYKYAEKELKKIKEKYISKLPEKVELKYIIKSGRIYREIVGQAESFKDSCVVASTHGASGFEKFFIGSNAFKIISATRKPVFTIRGNTIPKKIDQIIFPLDISADTRQKLPFTAELAKWFGATVHVITATSLQTEDVSKKLSSYSNQVCEYLDKREIKYKTEALIGSNFTDLVIDYAKTVKADLISIMTEQASDGNFIMGTSAQQMLNKSSLPVLCINPKELHIL
ncbi:MAG: universal stress protein [Bacteroidales bacterium]|jgi:nucleotide-binding universal stress UspA family protein|nr:universal stress protein [Bacteroidales bacterium]